MPISTLLKYLFLLSFLYLYLYLYYIYYIFIIIYLYILYILQIRNVILIFIARDIVIKYRKKNIFVNVRMFQNEKENFYLRFF